MVQKNIFLFLFLLFIWEEPVAHLQILTVKTKAKYKFSHDHVILYANKCIYLFSIPEIHQRGYRTCHYIAVGKVQNKAKQ
jgi:hypothetical protein